tara:strand:+ start:113 stop:547 length:435 start_codon:yes stop_codon:yes gene_type:complete
MATTDWVHQSRPNVLSATAPKLVFIRDINPDFTQNGGNNLVTEDDIAIQKQLRHLLSTPLGSEDFEPTFGSDLPYRLMDPICDLTSFLMETDIILSVVNWMSNKIILVNPRIHPYPDQDYYLAVLPYRKVVDGSLSTYSFEFGA